MPVASAGARRAARGAAPSLGHADAQVVLHRVESEEEAAALGFCGSPTIRVDGVDPVPPPAGEPTGLTCRVYRLADGRYSPTPDPGLLRAGIARLVGGARQEEAPR